MRDKWDRTSSPGIAHSSDSPCTPTASVGRVRHRQRRVDVPRLGTRTARERGEWRSTTRRARRRRRRRLVTTVRGLAGTVARGRVRDEARRSRGARTGAAPGLGRRAVSSRDVRSAPVAAASAERPLLRPTTRESGLSPQLLVPPESRVTASTRRARRLRKSSGRLRSKPVYDVETPPVGGHRDLRGKQPTGMCPSTGGAGCR